MIRETTILEFVLMKMAMERACISPPIIRVTRGFLRWCIAGTQSGENDEIFGDGILKPGERILGLGWGRKVAYADDTLCVEGVSLRLCMKWAHSRLKYEIEIIKTVRFKTD